jgi:hypothetical protein
MTNRTRHHALAGAARLAGHRRAQEVTARMHGHHCAALRSGRSSGALLLTTELPSRGALGVAVAAALIGVSPPTPAGCC